MFFVGENHEKLLEEFIRISCDHFQLSNYSTSELPIKLNKLTATPSLVHYPGKIFVDDDFVIISNSGRNKIIIADHLGVIKVKIVEKISLNA